MHHICIGHRLKIRDTELMRWFMCSCRKTASGDAGRCTGKLAWLSYAYTVFFLIEEGSRWLWHHLVMSQTLCLLHRVGRYIRRAHMSLKAIVWVFGAEHSGNLLRSHWPSVAATSVPLMEWEYILREKCSLFVHLLVPKVILGTFS